MFAEAPRQFLNFLYIFDVSKAIWVKMGPNASISNYFPTVYAGIGRTSPDPVTTINLVLLLLTFTFWMASIASLLGACFVYVPLLFKIRGNLKEYCVHKIDKRIGELLQRKSRNRVQELRRQEQDQIGFGGKVGGGPTLPSIEVDLSQKYESNSNITYDRYPQSVVSSYSLPAHGHGSERNFSDNGSETSEITRNSHSVYSYQHQPYRGQNYARGPRNEMYR